MSSSIFDIKLEKRLFACKVEPRVMLERIAVKCRQNENKISLLNLPRLNSGYFLSHVAKSLMITAEMSPGSCLFLTNYHHFVCTSTTKT